MYGFLKNLRFFEPFIILFFLEKNITFFQIGILYAIREIVHNFFEIPSGLAADFFGRRLTMIVSFVSYIASFILFFFATSFSVLAAAMVLYAIADAFRTGTHKAMIIEYLIIKGWEDQKVYYYGHTRSYSQLGSAFSALIGALLVFFSNNYQVVFLYSTIPYILDLLLLISYPKALDGAIHDRRKKGNISSAFRKTLRDFLLSFKSRSIVKAMGNLSIYSAYFKTVKDFLQPVIKSFAITLPLLIAVNKNQRSALLIGIIYFCLYILTSFSARNAGFISSKFRYLAIPLNISLILGFLLGLLSSIFYILNLTLIAIILFIGIFLIENIRKPIGVSYITEKINAPILASVLSAQSQSATLLTVLLAPLFGFVADKMGLGNAMIIIPAFLLCLIPAVMLKSK